MVMGIAGRRLYLHEILLVIFHRLGRNVRDSRATILAQVIVLGVKYR